MTFNPVLFGEVLFDCFEDGRQVLGGAPFNVAWHLNAFGQAPLLISGVGNDNAGERILQSMAQWQMSTQAIQVVQRYPTGLVQVQIKAGEPHYDIVYPAAWDFIEASTLSVSESIPFMYHGMLALRAEHNQRQWSEVTQKLSAPLFMDVNLRDPWWQPESVWQWMQRATWIKLNAAELQRLVPAVNTEAERIEKLLQLPKLRQLLLTKGAAGAELYACDGKSWCVAPARIEVPFVDAVGAGDGFTAVFLLGVLQGWSEEQTLLRAQQFASAIVGIRGAISCEPAFYKAFRVSWGV